MSLLKVNIQGGPIKVGGGWKKIEKLISGGNVYLAAESILLIIDIS